MVPERAAYASSNALHIPHRAPRRAQSRSEKICSSCPAQKTEGECSRPVSRVLSDIAVRTVISLGVRSLVPSSSLPAASVSRRAVSRRLFGLAPIGVYRAVSVARHAVGSYPTVSPLPAVARRRSDFCGTVRRWPLAPPAPRRYLAICPLEPGLSSMHSRASRPSGRLHSPR